MSINDFDEEFFEFLLGGNETLAEKINRVSTLTVFFIAIKKMTHFLQYSTPHVGKMVFFITDSSDEGNTSLQLLVLSHKVFFLVSCPLIAHLTIFCQHLKLIVFFMYSFFRCRSPKLLRHL
jgi:hypothetical protein